MAPGSASSLQRELRNMGLTADAIDAIWPEWWSDDAETSLSATTELRYTVARRLGILPSTLFEDTPQFVLRDALFKNLGTANELEQAVLASFGVSVGKIALAALDSDRHELPVLSALELRDQLLQSFRVIDLGALLALCWSLGIPVLKNVIHPLRNKNMHAMAVRVDGDFAVLIERESRYPAQTAFTLAHELGHIFRGHLDDAGAVLDVQDPITLKEPDAEERSADRFALELLTGSDSPEFLPSISNPNSVQIADVAGRTSRETRISAGAIVMCLAYQTKMWRQCIGALKMIQGEDLGRPVREWINGIAAQQLDWDRLPREQAAYLQTVIGG